MKNRSVWYLLLAGVLCCGVMAWVDGVLRPGYGVKSAIKIAVFLLIPFLVSRWDRNLMFGEVFRFRTQGFGIALAMGVGLYGLILGAYFLLSGFVDFSGIVDSLSQNAGVDRSNFLFVSLYISFANSLLEEFFFRGFLFLNLKTLSGRKYAYCFSALAFSAYHVAMMLGWFHPLLTILVLAGLAVGGGIFNWLNEKLGTIYVSWLVHMFANFAINTIGFLLMG